MMNEAALKAPILDASDVEWWHLDDTAPMSVRRLEQALDKWTPHEAEHAFRASRAKDQGPPEAPTSSPVNHIVATLHDHGVGGFGGVSDNTRHRVLAKIADGLGQSAEGGKELGLFALRFHKYQSEGPFKNGRPDGAATHDDVVTIGRALAEGRHATSEAKIAFVKQIAQDIGPAEDNGWLGDGTTNRVERFALAAALVINSLDEPLKQEAMLALGSGPERQLCPQSDHEAREKAVTLALESLQPGKLESYDFQSRLQEANQDAYSWCGVGGE